MTITAQPTQASRPTRSKARWWPLAAGIAAAAFIVLDLAAGVELAKVLAASAVVYIGAAALERPRAAWPVFFATVAVITVGNIVPLGFDIAWAVLGVGFALAAYGVARRAWRSESGFPLQSLGLLAFGGLAATAILVQPTAGSYLVALGLLAHAAWDAYHHWKNRTVVRSMAEFCMVLDTALAVTILVLTATS